MRGFALPLLIIPIAVIGLASIVASVIDNDESQLSEKGPESISRAITTLPSPSPAPSPQENPSPSPEPSPTSPPPEIVDEPKIDYQAIAKEAPSPSPKPVVTSNTTLGVNYTVSTFNLGGTTVVTDTANEDDCGNNCPTKALANYVAENSGRAGINGTYFCPPDYNSCSSKVNSFDFSVWNNREKKWINASSLFWSGRGMMVFRPGSAQFFPNASAVGAPSNITGGLTNYPSLLAGGQDVLNEAPLPDSLRVTKGTRGGIGFGSGELFLVVARGANMRDMVNIFKALGATDAMNLDGGGSAALYDGGYKAGPGRNLPNAIVVK